jgi:hypothetical protein
MIETKSVLAVPAASRSPFKDWLGNLLNGRLRTVLIVYFLVCIGIFAVGTAHWKQVNDPAQLHYLCFLMDHGFAPYRDLLEINMPGIYLVNWSVMHTLGAGSGAWRAFDFALLGLAAWAMIAIARPYDWLAGFFGATVFILYHGRDGAEQQGQRDFIIAVLLLCTYALLFYAVRSRRQWPMLAFGVCGGIASTIKPMPLPFVLLLLALAAVHWKRSGQPVWRPTLYALLGLIAPLAVVGAFLAAHHSLGAFWYLLHVELPFYGKLLHLPWYKLVVLIGSGSVKTLAILALAIALMKRDWWNWEGKLLVVGILFGVASYFAQGKGFPYHRYPLFAFLFLWAGLQVIPGLRERRMVRGLAIAGLAFVVIVAPLYVNEAIHRVWDPTFSNSLTADLNHLGGSVLSGRVQCIDTLADCDTTLYRMRLVQSTGLFYDYLIFGSSQQRVIRDGRAKFWQQFERNTPEVVVVGTGLFPDGYGYSKLATWPAFERELANHYVLYVDRSFPPTESGPKAYRVYVEKNKFPALASLRPFPLIH